MGRPDDVLVILAVDRRQAVFFTAEINLNIVLIRVLQTANFGDVAVQPGDEIIMPTLTYIATANSAKYCGAVPVFVDSEEGTFNMDPKKIEEKITSKTKAIMPVHLYGQVCNMDAINLIAERNGLKVLEDACQAHGAIYSGSTLNSPYNEVHAGCLGHAAVFSF